MAEIKIYGTLVNMTTDQKLALTRQLYDETLEKFQDIINKETEDNINTINESISSITSNLETIVVDNLTSDDTTKALSAKQGKVLKSLIDAIKSFSIIVLQEGEDLPEIGNPNTIYFKKKEGSDKDIYNEYIYIETAWELIGSTEVDLSNYYTKDQVYSKTEVDEKIPDIETVASGSGNVITSITVDSENKHKINISKDIDVYTKSEIDSKLSDSGLGDVIAAAEFTTENRVIVANGAGKVVKDSGILIENLALKSYVDEKEIAWDKVTGKPETYAPSEHKHDITDINDFPEIPDPIQVDSELSSSSENPVQNKVIEAALKNKLDSTVLENYYNKEEVDSKISAAGGGDVAASGDLTSNNLIIGAGPKSIKDSGTALSSLATKSEVSTPTTFAWTDGTTSGPTGSLSGNNMEPVAYPAIPSASKTTSGVVTTGEQVFSGEKTFDSVTCERGLTVKRHSEADYPRIDFIDGNYPYGSSYITPIKYTGTSAEAEKVVNKLKFTGDVTAEYDGSSEVTINISNNSSEIPIALPNPYPIKFTGASTSSYDGSSAVTVNIPKPLTYYKYTYSATSVGSNTGNGIEANQFYYPDPITESVSTDFTIMVKADVFNSEKSCSIVAVKGTRTVKFEYTSVYGTLVKQVDILTTGSSESSYRLYAFTYVGGTGSSTIVAVNCAEYVA